MLKKIQGTNATRVATCVIKAINNEKEDAAVAMRYNHYHYQKMKFDWDVEAAEGDWSATLGSEGSRMRLEMSDSVTGIRVETSGDPGSLAVARMPGGIGEQSVPALGSDDNEMRQEMTEEREGAGSALRNLVPAAKASPGVYQQKQREQKERLSNKSNCKYMGAWLM